MAFGIWMGNKLWWGRAAFQGWTSTWERAICLGGGFENSPQQRPSPQQLPSPCAASLNLAPPLSTQVPSGQIYKSPGEAYVEGDASSASYFLAGATITGGTIVVEGCGSESLQGDVRFAEVGGRV